MDSAAQLEVIVDFLDEVNGNAKTIID